MFKSAVYVPDVRDNMSPSNHVTIVLILAKNKLIILHKSHVFFISWIARYMGAKLGNATLPPVLLYI